MKKDRFIQPKELKQYYASLTSRDIEKAFPIIEQLDVSAFIEYAYQDLFIINFDWMQWKEGQDFYVDGRDNGNQWDFSDKDSYYCFRMLTTICRGDRFNEGLLDQALKSGFMHQLFGWLNMLMAFEKEVS